MNIRFCPSDMMYVQSTNINILISISYVCVHEQVTLLWEIVTAVRSLPHCYRFRLPKVGLWTVLLRNPGPKPTHTQLIVTSMAPSDDSYPIRLWTDLSHQEVDLKGRKQHILCSSNLNYDFHIDTTYIMKKFTFNGCDVVRLRLRRVNAKRVVINNKINFQRSYLHSFLLSYLPSSLPPIVSND